MIVKKLKSIIKRIPIISSPRGYFSARSDYKKTFRECEFIRNHKFIGNKGKTVLFALASGMIYEAKIHAMWALGLKMEGWNVKILLSRTYVWAKRYFEAFGMNDFIFWEDITLSSGEKRECVENAASFDLKNITFQSVKTWKYLGANIGPQIISTVSRYVMQGAPDVTDPFIKKHIARLLPTTLETVHLAYKLYESVDPQMMVVIEANYAIMGALADTAINRGINVIQTVQPSRDDAFILKKLTSDTRRFHPASVSPETLGSFADFPWGGTQDKELEIEFNNRYGGKWFLQSRNQPEVKKKSREEMIKELNIDPSKKIATVFSHILWDANLFYGEDLFEDYGDWFVQTVKAAAANSKVNWLIKLHPANMWKRAREKFEGEFSEVELIKKEIGELPSHIKLIFPNTDISTWSLFELCDYGVTVRGTIGMELPCLGVPVFTAGTGRYSGLGFTNDSSSKEEYLNKILHMHEFGRLSEEETMAAKKHAYIAFRLRPWIMKSFKSVFNYKKKGVHPLDSNLLMNIHSFDEISANGDLKKWAVWAQLRDQVDYLDIDEINEWKSA